MYKIKEYRMATKPWEEFVNDDKNAVVAVKNRFVFQTKGNNDCRRHKYR